MTEQRSQWRASQFNEVNLYMANLYEKLGMGDGSDLDLVLERAQVLWKKAEGIGQRIPIAEVIVGRLISGTEARDLPHDFMFLMHFGGDFQDMVVNALLGVPVISEPQLTS